MTGRLYGKRKPSLPIKVSESIAILYIKELLHTLYGGRSSLPKQDFINWYKTSGFKSSAIISFSQEKIGHKAERENPL